jgi:hypothetical protein
MTPVSKSERKKKIPSPWNRPLPPILQKKEQ